MSKSAENITPPASTDSATAEALSLLVINLNRFNTAFAENTRRLDSAIDKLNRPHEARQAVEATLTLPAEADIRRVAAAQIETLHKMQELLDSYRSEMGRAAALSDASLRSALNALKDATATNIEQLNSMFITQSQQFKSVLNDERSSFEQINTDIAAQFNRHLEQMPQLAQQLQLLADIPSRLDTLIERIIESQTMSMVNVNRSIRQALDDAVGRTRPAPAAPRWLYYVSATAMVVSAICLLSITLSLL